MLFTIKLKHYFLLNPKHNIALIILAAGGSSRMGTPKQLLKWGKNTLLEHCIQQATATAANEFYLLLGANQEAIQDQINLSKVNCMVNPNWKLGLGNSIAFAAQQLINKELDGLLFILADQPTVTTDYINQLIHTFKGNHHQIIASNYGANIGVPVLFGRHYLKELSRLKDDQGAKFIIQQHHQNTIKLNPEFKLIDIDTPSAYKKFYEEKFKAN